MIHVPPGPIRLLPEMLELIKFFNDLEEKLQYPNSDGYEDQARYLREAERELIRWGKI